MASIRGTGPRVSIIVRTMGRDVLQRALASAASQTLRPFEIVLVDAAARGVAMDDVRGAPIHVVGGGPYDRPRAANAGMDAARGDWMLFLDEDDEIAPDHLAILATTAGIAGTRVAYSQTRMVDAAGRTLRVFGGPFDRQALLRSNFLQMNAVLFHRDVPAAGCRFDESLATLEDWDFWLQASSRFPFAFSGQPTAIYHAHEGTSGAGSGGNLDREAMLSQRDRLMAKWRAA